MSEKRRDSVKAGIFVLVSVGVFVTFLVVLLGRGWFRSERTYYTVFEHSIQGLDKGSPVKYLGVPAGTVSDIRFEEREFPKIKVTLKLKEFIPIKEGTRAKFTMTALTGIGSIELVGGMEGEQELSDGARIPAEVSFYEKIYESVPEILEKLPVVLGRIEKAAAAIEAIFAKENQDRFSNTLAKLDEAAGELVRQIRSTSESVQRELSATSAALREEVAATAGAVRTALKEARDVVAGEEAKKVVSDLQGFSSHLASSWERVDRTIAKLEAALRADERTFADALAHLRDAVRAGSDLLQRLRQDPSILVFSSPAPERNIPEPSKKGSGK